MQHRTVASRATVSEMLRIETRGTFRAQRRHPVDRSTSLAFARRVAAFCLRLFPSKAMPRVEGIRVEPSMVQAFFAASGLTCLTFAVPVGSGGM
ncbi:hypothetical protein AWB76_03224 [Caballeronia temeraria]|uniref:Uncharacterized protein n=1 Tax=Caballeronia temeraria TaxID=1777137 RepID=A0A158AX97_9BURK|nr:hypothetical protein AWB76_03224 [Caballeronia temeraria]